MEPSKLSSATNFHSPCRNSPCLQSAWLRSLAKLLLLCLAVAGGLTVPARGQPSSLSLETHPEIHNESLTSKSLGRKSLYRVLLPVGYEHSARRYPVLYLLHGLFGDYTNWTSLTHLPAYAMSMNFIIVTPDAANSWYVNSATIPQDRFEDFIIQDLVPEIDAKYRTIPAREGRAIAGLSMGGYGALKFALKNPHMFTFAGSLSGALNAPRDLEVTRPEFSEGLRKVFGPSGSATRANNDIFAIIPRLPAPRAPAPSAPGAKTAAFKTTSPEPPSSGAAAVAASRLPYLYLDCGTEDSFIQTNREFISLIHEKLRYEYHEVPGSHAWTYWDARLPFLLQVVQQNFASHLSGN